MTHARAELCWVPAEAGGRSQMPSSPYTTIATFAEAGPATDEPWSLVCTFDAFDRQDGGCITARVHFLFEEAPHHLLRPGAAFELREGEQVVARGAVESVIAEGLASEQ